MKHTIAAVGLTLAGVSAFPALAQEAEVANNAMFGNWQVVCDAVSTTRTTCRILQLQTMADSGALIAQLLAYPLDDGGALFIAQVPMGVHLPGGAVYRFAEDEEAEQRELVWQRCAGQICEAAIQMDAAEVAAVNDAGALLFGYLPQRGGEPLVTRIDTSTFAEALDAVRGD